VGVMVLHRHANSIATFCSQSSHITFGRHVIRCKVVRDESGPYSPNSRMKCEIASVNDAALRDRRSPM
jgi:hypothetical protein